MSQQPRSIECLWSARAVKSRSGEAGASGTDEGPFALSGDQLRERYHCGFGAGLAAVMVASLDGATVVAGRSGMLSSAADQWHMDVVRSAADAVVVAAGTVREEGYGPLRVADESVRWRRARGLGDHPVFVLVSASASPDPNSPIFTDAPVRPLVAVAASAARERIAALERVADVLVLSPDEDPTTVCPRRLVNALHERELHTATTEGGPSWLGHAVATGVVSDTLFTLSPALVGGDAPRVVGSAAPPAPEDLGDLSLRHVLREQSLLIPWYGRSRTET